MFPLARVTAAIARSMPVLLSDVDDTIVDHGALGLEAYAAVHALARTDPALPLVLVTGRPAAWGELLVRMWPVAAALSENGTIVSVRDGARVTSTSLVDASVVRRPELDALASEIRAVFPELRFSDDVGGRQSDVTFDVGENETVDPATIARVVAYARERGARTTVSSVHLHVGFSPLDKASGSLAFLGQRFGLDPSAARARVGFVGDSGNDAACFGAFFPTFGVANVRAALARLSIAPRFVAEEPRGRGFAAIVERLIALRG